VTDTATRQRNTIHAVVFDLDGLMFMISNFLTRARVPLSLPTESEEALFPESVRGRRSRSIAHA
jgi:hypothetical protein